MINTDILGKIYINCDKIISNKTFCEILSGLTIKNAKELRKNPLINPYSPDYYYVSLEKLFKARKKSYSYLIRYI